VSDAVLDGIDAVAELVSGVAQRVGRSVRSLAQLVRRRAQSCAGKTRRVVGMTDEQQQERAVAGAWARIEAWPRQHAPRSYRTLPPPAPEADIRELEQELDLAVPPGVKAFYRLRNGTGHPADFGWTPEPRRGFLRKDRERRGCCR
jgi:hypothetical protein